MTETRRHALKMLGTVGLTCAFPFSGDELYGQHVHVTLAQTPPTGPYAPAFFTPAEYATLSRLADVIIPATGTPGARPPACRSTSIASSRSTSSTSR